MAVKNLLEQIARNPHLPSPPAIALQVMEQAGQPNCSMAALAKLISQDPALCAKILKLINSALFHLPRAVSSIDRALGLLGLRRVRSLALALTLPAAQQRVGTAEQMRNFWKASVAGAIVARELAVKLNWADPENELVAGLLRDLGTLTLQQQFPDQYARILARSAPEQLHFQCALEEELVGLNHAEVSAFLLRRWRLPDDMTNAICYHHNPDQAGAAQGKPSQRACLLHFASLAAQLQIAPHDARLLRQTVDVAERYFGMGEEPLRAFLEPLTEHIQEFAALLDVDVGACEGYGSILTRSVDVLTDLAVETTLDSLRTGEEKDRAEEALRQAEAQLRQAQKMEVVGRLAGGVAHDFNNLLTVISGNSELLLAEFPSGPVRQLVEEIKQAGDRAALLTRQLLAFSRKQVLQPELVDLNAVVSGMKTMIRRLIGKDIELVTDLAPELRTVHADVGQIEQILMNLIVNARDATPQQGRILIRTTNHDLDEAAVRAFPDLQPGPYVLLAVSDTGCGMDEHTKMHLFEPFFTTKEKGKGTGLGLATVYGIIKQSEGHITVESQPGRGSTFTILLPSADAAPPPLPVPAVSQARPGTETVLLVEDENAVRAITRQILCGQGYTVLEARSSDDALRLCGQHTGPIHLLLTDVILPQMSGRDLVERLMPARPDMKVLYITGYADDTVLRPNVGSTEVALISKPFGARELVTRVRKLLGR